MKAYYFSTEGQDGQVFNCKSEAEAYREAREFFDTEDVILDMVCEVEDDIF